MTPKTNFLFDPQRQGYDTNLWKTLSGVPAINTNKLRLNAASIVHYADLYGCDLTMTMNIPAAPIAGDSRRFGLSSVNLGAYIVFDITGAVFTIQAIDGLGNTKTTTIDFLAAWAGSAIDYEIRWRGTYADFLINHVPVIDTTDATNKTYAANYRLNDIAIPKGPLSVYIRNTNADNLDITAVVGKNIQTFI